MRAQEAPTSDVGSYLSRLALRAVACGCNPPLLAGDLETYLKCKADTVKNLAPMARLIDDNRSLEKLLASQFEQSEKSFPSRDAYLYKLIEKAMESEIPAELPVDELVYRECLDASICGLDPMLALLEANPPLQEQLAFFLDYVPSRWLLEAEIPTVIERRRRRNPHTKLQDDRDIYQWARKNNLTGLCLSGGGIRSATFNLGVLQGLAGLGILGQFDYLSSVSGGGYIHEWLASWIKREDERISGQGRDRYRDGLEAVEDKIKPVPADANHPFSTPPIRWLRRYSNYLTPHKGLFTADTWVAIAIWVRNTFLNQIILVSLLFSLVLLPHLLTLPVQGLPVLWSTLAIVLFTIATATFWSGLHKEYIRVRHYDIYGVPHDEKEMPRVGESGVLSLVIVPLLLACFLLTLALVSGLPVIGTPVTLGAAITVQLAGMAFAGGTIRVYRLNHGMVPGPETPPSKTRKQISLARQFTQGIKSAWVFVHGSLLLVLARQKTDEHKRRAGDADTHWRIFLSAVLGSTIVNSIFAACGGVGVFLGVAALLQSPGVSASWRVQLTIGPPLLLFVPLFSMMLMAGLVGRNFDDWLREWIARVRAWCLLFSLGWTAYFGISLLGPWLFNWLQVEYQHHPHVIQSIKWTAVLSWVFATAGSVLAGKSRNSSGTADDSSVALNVIARVGPWVFILGLLLLLSRAADFSFEHLRDQPLQLTLLLIVPIAAFLLFGWRVDVNVFSMNSFYRNRLTRCYLGATNPVRDPSSLTGFDDRDTRGLQISKLQPSENYSGPLPIINTTLNLSFGEDLAYQERKAASFFFSPLFSGYTVGWTSAKQGCKLSFNGFVPTSHYCSPDGGINIATAVAISGAAASPNWGFHTNPGTAFLMTLFNVRLGWWIFNPRRSKLAGRLPDCANSNPEWPSPRFAPLQLARELLGIADDTSKYVYLSDGGHFDNMGLYELVRRRCHRIVICDAECDENYAFEGLAMAIRKCRVDFGVEILLPDISRLRQSLKSGNCKAHFVTGTIRYPESPVDKKDWGTILYIKSSLTGKAKFKLDPDAEETRKAKSKLDLVANKTGRAKFKRDPVAEEFTSLEAEAVDILNYKLQHNCFPHDTTANQWFSESQFESYRRLGQHIVEEIECCSGWKGYHSFAPAEPTPPGPHAPGSVVPEPALTSGNGRE